MTRLYNPRADSWPDHFRLEGATIVPLNEVGEVTANLLRFNAVDRIIERTALMESGRYPSVAASVRMRGATDS